MSESTSPAPEAPAFEAPVVNWKAHLELVSKHAENIGGSIDWLSTVYFGEAFIGEGNEMAHPTVLIGPMNGPVGHAACFAFANPQRSHTPMMAVVRPNVRAPIFTVVVNEVSMQKLDQAVLLGGPMQRALADVVRHCCHYGVLPRSVSTRQSIAIVFQGFIHPAATDVHKIYAWNYWAGVECIVRAITRTPSLETIEADTGEHPYSVCPMAKLPEGLKPLDLESKSSH